jgi:acyl carrier protein
MTARADVVARIADKIQFLTGIDPASLVHDKPVIGQAGVDSLDLMEIGMAIEEEFALTLETTPDTTIDSIADAVMAARN